MKKGFLVVENGPVFEGVSLGGVSRAGELVFNTSHSGYEEIATDPSYFSQIMIMTAPMMGNYAVDRGDWESEKLWIHGFVSLELQSSLRDQAWLERLREYKVPTLTQVDTRSLVTYLRDHGTQWGAIILDAQSADEAIKKSKGLIDIEKAKDTDWVYTVTGKEKRRFMGQRSKEQGGIKLGLLDFGCKSHIIRESLPFASEVLVYPSRTSSDEILNDHIDKLILSNGPGNPEDVQVARTTVADLVGKVPMLGICMGHQVMALALKAKTYRLKFGHRGSNHPVKDKLLKRTYVTSQNHGYAVEQSSLPGDIEVTHINLNDQTVSGFYSKTKRLLGIQFHPESHPGPHDAAGLFSYFFKEV